MKEGWEYIEFKDVFPIRMGKTPPRGDKSSWDEKKETNNKWVSIADISNNEGKIIEDTKEYISDTAATKINKVTKGSLLMSFKLSIGRMAFAGDDLYTNEAIIAIPESNKYNLRFMYYYLLSYDWLSLTEGNEKVKGATLNKTSIGKIQLPVLSLSEQQSIVDCLDSAFAKIDAMKANTEKALNEAQALFQASLKEMLEPKERGGYKKLGEVIEHLRTGLNPRTHFKLNTPDAEGYYVTVRELKGFAIEPDEKTDKVNKSAIKRINERSNLKIGDVLFSGTGTIGKTALVTELPENWNIKEGVYAMTPKHSELDSKYFIYYIGSDLFLRLVNDKAAGTGVRSIPMKELVKLPISVPPLSEQQSIVETLDSLKSKVDRLQENYDKISQECDALKQAILRQVFE